MTTEKAATRLRAKTDWERANDRAFLGIDERGQDVGKDPELMPSAQHSITMTPTDVARYVKKAVECLHQASQALGAATGNHPGSHSGASPHDHDEWLNLMHAEGEIKASEQFLTVM